MEERKINFEGLSDEEVKKFVPVLKDFMQAYADAVLKQERGMHHENFSATCDSEM